MTRGGRLADGGRRSPDHGRHRLHPEVPHRAHSARRARLALHRRQHRDDGADHPAPRIRAAARPELPARAGRARGGGLAGDAEGQGTGVVTSRTRGMAGGKTGPALLILDRWIEPAVRHMRPEFTTHDYIEKLREVYP